MNSKYFSAILGSIKIDNQMLLIQMVALEKFVNNKTFFSIDPQMGSSHWTDATANWYPQLIDSTLMKRMKYQIAKVDHVVVTSDVGFTTRSAMTLWVQITQRTYLFKDAHVTLWKTHYVLHTIYFLLCLMLCLILGT